MSAQIHRYRPDYAVPPGWVLEERLEAQGLSQAEFARRCGRSPKLISEIISGKAPVEPETALQFEKVLGVDARIWMGVESEYQLFRARAIEAKKAESAEQWLKKFPIRELADRGCFARPKTNVDACSKLLGFFQVGSVDAWSAKYDTAHVAYRHSPTFKSNTPALTAWLKLAELDAQNQPCNDYNESSFRAATQEARSLTLEPVDMSLNRLRSRCNEAGVALALVKPFKKTALSGAAWWLNSRKAVIALSARHKSDDHLWFSFFHEAAHVLLHSKKDVFVDNGSSDSADLELEADEWAHDALVPRNEWKRFVAGTPRSKQAVCKFAADQGVAPGIIVGMLQHERVVPWTHLNGLKVRFEWKD